MPTAGPADDAAIREQAYFLWEQEGRPEGRDTEYWMRATIAVTEKRQLDTLTEEPPGKAKAKPKSAANKAKVSPAKRESAKKGKKT